VKELLGKFAQIETPSFQRGPLATLEFSDFTLPEMKEFQGTGGSWQLPESPVEKGAFGVDSISLKII
jgi:hypothetical protein